MRSLRLFLIVATLGLVGVSMPAAHAAPSPEPLYGTGSTWSENAVAQWITDVQPRGLTINYGSGGSSKGRGDFANGSSNFAVTEIPYQGRDPLTGAEDTAQGRPYAYIPIVAGGTAFMYHIEVGGKLYKNLRLSGEVITKIFTGVITDWSDPAITADNNGVKLPQKKIIPVVRSDGSGTTAQLTAWMDSEYGGLWSAYCQKSVGKPCGSTSYYPINDFPGGAVKAQANSAQMAGYIAAKYADGAIGYVEYSYAINKGYPVAKVRNKADYYVDPNFYGVAVGLTQAQINQDPASPDYLTQRLQGVYRNADARAYPLSSYSYMIIPTSPDKGFTEGKGVTLSTFGGYFLCQGQQKAPELGYSPLPLNLVQAAFDQLRKVPGAVPGVDDITKCDNPTFDGKNLASNKLAALAPMPPACDKVGAGPCGASAPPPPPGKGAKGSTAAGGAGTQAAPAAGADPATGAGAAAAAPAAVDPGTGQPVDLSAVSATTGLPSAVEIGADRGDGSMTRRLSVLAVVELMAVILIPTLLLRALARRRTSP